ncbi:thiolase family protein [Nocardia sp. NPDC005745]|uniref:thiolase family protein n=1 Tax=Nocardia sp. NPDC005745 TaxID=3157061 RepID=UPI0033E17840
MRDAVIVEAVRTPLGKRNGGLKGIHPADLSAHVLNAVISRTGIDPAVVDDVIWGCVSQVGEQTFDIARTAALSAGWPDTVPGTTVDRQCGSSQQAVHFAAAGVIAGHYDMVVAGGVESMSRIPMMSAMVDGLSPLGAEYQKRYGTAFPNQGLAAEAIAKQWGLDRAAVDAYSLRSHERAAEARAQGRFEPEIAAVTSLDGTVVAADEGIRIGGTLEILGKLKPAFDEAGVVTAGNSSQITDGAAALLITSSDTAKTLGLVPIARVHTAVVTGADPTLMLSAPIPATRKALERSGLALSDIGVFEVNEAFASVALAWHAEFDVPAEQLNPNGGAIALGHPLGGSGARIMTTMINHMRCGNIRYGLQTMCEGGGQANATILELL